MTRAERMDMPWTETRVAVAGTDSVLELRRETGSGRLVRMSSGNRVYLERIADGWTTYGDGMASTHERWDGNAIVRDVRMPLGDWQERFAFDGDGRLAHVDGVDVHRDAVGRVTACLPGGDDPAPPSHRWFYAYSDRGLVSIDAPSGMRHIGRGPDGEVLTCRAGGQSLRFGYDMRGARRGVARLPDACIHRDNAGRTWTVTGAAGRVTATYLWDGWRCIGRIDGPPGAPLAAVFDLDPTATPVRVITRDAVLRVPRDAFGEGLVAHPRVAGLFGAFQHGGLHHLPWRAIDPTLGSFTGRDPFDGSERDPRRKAGPGDVLWEGPVLVEPEGTGSYEVCRNDPIGRADPSGGISAGLLISSLTWSFQNNLVSFFGIDWWFNLFGSLITAASPNFSVDRFGSSEGLVASDHIGSFGVRRDGLIPFMTDERAFTTQHIVWSGAPEFDELKDGMVVDPKGRFDPPLLGGYLIARPTDAAPFLLRASPGGNAQNWSRAGGPAEATFPGAAEPVFPSGGFHLANGPLPIHGPRACPLTELVPGPGLTRGAFDPADADPFVRLDRLVEGLTIGEDVLLIDAADALFLTTVATDVQTGATRRLTFNPVPPPAFGPNDVTLRRLAAATTAENVQASARGGDSFDARGLAETYNPGDVLVLTDAGGANQTVARVTGAEARILLDRPVANAHTAPITVSAATLGANRAVALSGTTDLDFAPGAAPAIGTLGLVSDGINRITVRLVSASGGTVMTTDTDLATAGLGAPLSFRPITATAGLGRRRADREPDPRFTYVPTTPGTALDGSVGVVAVVFSSPTAPDTARIVTGAPAFDAIVLDRAIAGAAPWQAVKRIQRLGSQDVFGLSIGAATALRADAADVLTGAAAVRILNVAASGGQPTPNGAARVSGLSLSGATGTVTGSPGDMVQTPAMPFGPSDVVLVRQGQSEVLASLMDMRLAFTTDRDVTVAAGDAFLVRLATTGPAYQADRVAGRQIALRPVLVSTNPAQFPRIRTGALLLVSWTPAGGAAQTQTFRVGAVSGLTVTLEGPEEIPVGATQVSAQRLQADDPGTGHQKIGIAVTQVGAAPGRRLSALVWDGNMANVGASLAVVSGGVTTPFRVADAGQTLTLRFARDPELSGLVDVFSLNVMNTLQTANVVNIGGAMVVEEEGLVPPATVGVLLLQPFVDGPAAAASAELNPGTLLTPDREESEVDRRQALIDHELTHTEQYHKWGPLWFCYFPLFLLELPVELATDLDMPEYGPFASGTVSPEGSSWRLVLDPGQMLDADEDDKVQIVQGGTAIEMTVVGRPDANFDLRAAGDTPNAGGVQARKRNSGGEWSEVLLSISRVLTHGGLLNTLVGFTWGGLIWLLAKGVYGIGRAIFGTGDLYPADVAVAGLALELKTDEGKQAVNGDGRVTIKQGDATVVRTTTREGDLLLLDSPIEFEGEVRVAMYDSHDPDSHFDWLDYRAGTVDSDNPFRITVPDHGGDFSRRDRVEYIYIEAPERPSGRPRSRGVRTHVTAVDGDDLELEEAVALVGDERSIRIAKVGAAADTLGDADNAALLWMGMGWMRILFDPYGQIEARVDAQETWAKVLLRVMRVVLGTRNWSFFLPPGYVFFSRLAPFLGAPPEHLTAIEQEASSKSGDLYTPLARLTGQVSRSSLTGTTTMVVGDIARYRYWRWNGDRVNLNLIDRTQMGAPGVHADIERMRIVVQRTTAGGTGFEPNGVVESDGAGAPGSLLPDIFAVKDVTDPDIVVPRADPAGYDFADLAEVPASATRMRTLSGYVAFCGPGQHRATVRNFDPATTGEGGDLQHVREAQDIGRQPIFFDVAALDVTVQVNGADVAEGDEVALVQTQTAEITIQVPPGAPSGGRTFRATVRRPDDSPLLRQIRPLRLQAQGANGTGEPVEISRYYPFDTATGAYSDPALGRFGAHLGSDIDIPVRRFRMRVEDTLVLRAAADPVAALVNDLAQDTDAFVLIPTSAANVAVYTINGAPSGAGDPALVFEEIPTPAAAEPVVGPLGQVRRIRFAAAPALAGPAPAEIAVPVAGEDGTAGTLRITFNLTPP